MVQKPESTVRVQSKDQNPESTANDSEFTDQNPEFTANNPKSRVGIRDTRFKIRNPQEQSGIHMSEPQT